MLAIALATLLLGPDFPLTRAEITTLNELREASADVSRTIDYVTLREGTPVQKAKIPIGELHKVDAALNDIVGHVKLAQPLQGWVGNRTKDYDNEFIDVTWKFYGQPVLWTDFEGTCTMMLRPPSDLPLMLTPEDAKDTLPGLMAKLLDLPKGIPAYRFYLKKRELPSGGTALTGYAALLKAEQDGIGTPFDVPREKQWAVSIQVTIAERLVIFRFSYPGEGQGGGQGPRPKDYKRPYSRFNPPRGD